MIEFFTMDSGDFADLGFRHAAEKREIPQQVEAVFFIPRFLRSVGGEDEALLHLLHATMFLVETECCGETVSFVQVPNFWVHAEFIQQPRATRSEDDVLRDAPEIIMIVEAVGDRTGETVVFLDIGAEEEHRHRVENVAREKHGFHPHRMSVDGNGEANAGILQERIFLLLELHGKFALFPARLIVVAVGPENSDPAKVLTQRRGGAHVRARKKTESSGIDLEALVDRELAREIDRAFRILGRDVVVVGEGLW